MITIDVEARRLSKLSIDIDKMRQWYKTSNDIYVFPNPSVYAIEKNYYYLLRNSYKKDFDVKYKMRPDYLSFDEYGTTSLYPLLMIVNNVQCMEDFNLEKVIIPTMDAIIQLTQDNISYMSPSEYEEIVW